MYVCVYPESSVCLCVYPESSVCMCIPLVIRVFVLFTSRWFFRIRVFGWKKLKPLAILKYHKQVVNNVCFSKGHLIAAASKDGNISIWDVYKDS